MYSEGDGFPFMPLNVKLPVPRITDIRTQWFSLGSARNGPAGHFRVNNYSQFSDF